MICPAIPSAANDPMIRKNIDKMHLAMVETRWPARYLLRARVLITKSINM